MKKENAMSVRPLAALAATLALASPALAQRDFSKVEIRATEVAPGIFMLEGAGGNIGLSVGPDGAFMIDDQFAPLSEKITEAIASNSDQKVKFLVNTHWHGDHAGGNEPFRAAGAIVVAHENVRTRLKEGLKRENDETPPAPDAALPIVTFSDAATFYWNGEEIRVSHPDPAHTDGDAFVYFAKAGVLHMGDVFFSGRYPFIDLESGGSIDGFIAAQEAAYAMISSDARIIPGHGPLSTRADLAASIAMLKDARARIQALVDRGLSEDAAVKAKPLKDLDEKWSWPFITGDDMTRAAYRSLKRD
jgi:glyoxylase-like metal-dependent hydrolase (beta-lactamase superfamily II)